LYFRFPPPKEDDEEEEYRELDDADILFPNQSVNRDRYSQPEDVIFNFPGWGIGAIEVQQIPPRLESPGQDNKVGPTYNFKPVHKPEACNYAHAEIQVFSGTENVRRVSSNNIKKQYRTLMRQRARVHTSSRRLIV
jgi:hypothetical protein